VTRGKDKEKEGGKEKRKGEAISILRIVVIDKKA